MNEAPRPPRPIVAFDFDGTLTTRDSYTAFLRWRAGAAGYAAGGVRLLPDLLAYPLRRDRGALKAAATRVFLRGVRLDALAAEAERFAADEAQSLFRPDALACWESWAGKAQRVIVTASPEPVVLPFAIRLGADTLIGTRLAVDDDARLTGGFDGANCRGAQKVARLKAAFGEEVQVLAAYGDTAGDREMLAFADEGHMGVFTARPAPSSPSSSDGGVRRSREGSAR